MKVIKNSIILIVIVLFALVLRVNKLGEVPTGAHQDEISQAYNAYSILNSGKDRYGEPYPILFRSFGSYQPPIYTYLATVPIYLWGNTIFSIRLISAISGVLAVILTYLIALRLFVTKKRSGINLALIAALVITISPWAIHFSRLTVEANVGLSLFLLGYLLLIESKKNIYILLPAVLVLGVSTHAYYSERIISIALPLAYLLFNFEYFSKYNKILMLAGIIFFLSLSPHYITIRSGAFANRLNQVSNINNQNLTARNLYEIVPRFIKNSFTYLSPRYLFSDSGNKLGRVSPDLGVFYAWMSLPFVYGLISLVKSKEIKSRRLLIALLLISLIPASITGDVFYPLRALEYFWIISLIISLGLWKGLSLIKNNKLYMLVMLGIVVYSTSVFYISYFILFTRENAVFFGHQYLKLVEVSEKYKNMKIIIDNGRDSASGLRFAYFKKYDLSKIQQLFRSQMKSPYYSSFVNADEEFIFENIEVRPIVWSEDKCLRDTLLVGDKISLSDPSVSKYGLRPEFRIDSWSRTSETAIFGYFTDPSSQSDCK